MMTELVILDEAAVKRLKKAVNTDSDLIVWVGDWLSHLNLFSDAQIYDILRFVQPEAGRFEEEVSADLDRRVAMLAVCDSRWVSFTGVPMFLDTETSELVPELGEYAVTHIMCDLAALRARMLYRQGRFNAKRDSNENPPELHEAE
jgi:hypothetical protein